MNLLQAKEWTWKQWWALGAALAVLFAVFGFLAGWWLVALVGAGTTVEVARRTLKAVEDEATAQRNEEAAKMKRALMAIRMDAATKINDDAKTIESGAPDEAKETLLGALKEAEEARRIP